MSSSESPPFAADLWRVLDQDDPIGSPPFSFWKRTKDASGARVVVIRTDGDWKAAADRMLAALRAERIKFESEETIIGLEDANVSALKISVRDPQSLQALAVHMARSGILPDPTIYLEKPDFWEEGRKGGKPVITLRAGGSQLGAPQLDVIERVLREEGFEPKREISSGQCVVRLEGAEEIRRFRARQQALIAWKRTHPFRIINRPPGRGQDKGGPHHPSPD